MGHANARFEDDVGDYRIRDEIMRLIRFLVRLRMLEEFDLYDTYDVWKRYNGKRWEEKEEEPQQENSEVGTESTMRDLGNTS